jgi:PHP family Zn ribbon phosphoesterase
MSELKYDLHIHSCLSPCGGADMTPNNIAGMAMLSGIRVAALTDHNTSKNCPAFFEACSRRSVIPIAGMELTTLEDIHMVCLFPTLETAMDFDAYVGGHRMKIKNRPKIFGEQIIMNGNDEETGREEYLLIPATDIDLTSAARTVRNRGGAAFPAHIDKEANGLIPILGSFPYEPGFSAAEIFDESKLEGYKKKFPILDHIAILRNSDAHSLEGMLTEPSSFPGLDDNGSYDEIRRKIIKFLNGNPL